MGKLSEQIATECCGHLLGHEEKKALVKEVAKLEADYKAKTLQIVMLENELVALDSHIRNVAKQVFYATYTGNIAHIEKAWQQLCVELGTDR